jgi:tetratricopeptide (TPR) repeat protein/predicted Ser/Thr protein kinase
MDAPSGAEPMATFVLPGESGESPAPGAAVTQPPGTLVMDVPSGAGGTLVLPSQADSGSTLVVGDDQSLGEIRVASSAEGHAVAIQGYQVLGELGRGGMGVVYRARQIGLNRTVALKMIIAGGHAGSVQLARFRAEAEAVAQLQHPNIVQIYDIGEQDGLPYFSLEYVNGKPLDRELDGKPQPERKTAEMIETLARAMHYAHEHAIIHRDLKPANVLLTKTGVPKITDFGLAKQMDSESSQTKTGTVMGTPSYMAPEQGRGEKSIGHLADVYALGSMLYEMITGRPPFLAETVLKTLMRLLHEEPVPPSRLQPGVSRDLETICMKCLQKDPARRYATAADLADDLKRFQSGEPIRARPVGRPARAWRWCKRNPKLAVLYGTVSALVMVVAATAWSIVSDMNRDRAAVAATREQAEQRLEQATEAVASGNFSRAQDLLRWPDPILSSADELADMRRKLSELSTQIAAYADFRKLLDRVHYLGLFGGTVALPKAKEASHELIALFDQIEKREASGRHGWPPLNSHQQELLQEDIFEAFLVSSQIERTASLATGDESIIADATRLSIQWLNRVEETLPPTKAFFVWRGGYHDILGEKDAAKADFERAGRIEATSAVDRFWHAFADYRRAEEALQKGDNRAAGSFYRLAATGFAKVIEVRPENFWAHFSWATCLPRLGDGYGALVGFTNSIQIRPDVPWPYSNRGTIHFQLREFDRAIADFTEAIKVRPDGYHLPWIGRAEARLLKGDAKEAVGDADRAVEIEKGEGRKNCLAMRGRCKAAAGDRAGALEDLRKAGAAGAPYLKELEK